MTPAGRDAAVLADDDDDAALADDADIIERSWLQPEQFAALFDRHAPRIHRYVARRVGREVADDLVAETFLAAFARRRLYDSRYPHIRAPCSLTC